MSEATLKNVVVIGASGAGAQLAHSLEKTLPKDHRIVLIEANEFAYWPIGALRAAVQPGFEKEVFASLDGFFGKDSRHVLLAGYNVTEIKGDSITLDRDAPAPFNGSTISVEIGVIATGSSYNTPMRPVSAKLDESVAALKKNQEDVKNAKHVVILGGGPVGVEFAGEIVAQHPGKSITIVQRDDRLIPGWREGLHTRLLAQAKAKGIDVRLNTSIDVSDDLASSSNKLLQQPQTLTLSDGSQIQCDFLFVGTGGKPNVDAVPKEALRDPKPGQLASPHARVAVDPATLRVEYQGLHDRWFCIGDASNSPDPKTYVAASAHAPVVASQVVAQASGAKAKKPKQHGGSPNFMVVPFGPSGGAAQMVYPVLGEWVTSLIKGKTLFISKFTPVYPGGQPLK
jgi:NADH dehydrogenase FAD-containing subunit